MKGAQCPVGAYAKAVVTGRVLAGKLVRLACQRHLDDLKNARGLKFEKEEAAKAIRFFQHLKHYKGEWAGQPFILDPWQCFIVGSIFGWKRADGLRRFRVAYEEIARKNGKSQTAAGVGIKLGFFDQEPGAEVYCAATKRDQAKIVFGDAKRMVVASAGFRKEIGVFTSNLHSTGTNSKMEPLGADADTMDGLNIHGAIIDELHAHKTRAMVDVIETATGARRQPLVFEITTAGFDRHSVCWEHREYSVKVLEGSIQDDSWFAYIATIDEGDDWADESVWVKANPGLGVSVKLDDLRRKCEKAKQLPGAQNAFKRLHLNVWTEVNERWIEAEAWDACGFEVDADELAGRNCFGGLDLSTTKDITAGVLVFPPVEDGEKWKVLCRFFVPEDSIRERVERASVPYDVWERQGLIEATEGNVVDYNIVQQRIIEDSEKFAIREYAFDRFNSTQLVRNLMDEGVNMVPFGQGFVSMSAPVKELEKLVLQKQIAHGGNPVLKWMASNISAKQDPAGNIKFDKSKSSEKIDGMVALAMALGRAIVQPAYQEPTIHFLDWSGRSGSRW